jgi:hypothetical protein
MACVASVTTLRLPEVVQVHVTWLLASKITASMTVTDFEHTTVCFGSHVLLLKRSQSLLISLSKSGA